MRLYVAVVHDEILRQEILERNAVNDIELAVSLQAIHHVVDAFLELIPILLVYLHFGLSHAEIFVEFLEVVVVVDLVELILLSYL